jgi:multidrug transporter EmrE-like cation transporter
MENVTTLANSAILLVPVFVMFLTKFAKDIEAVPVTSKNAKWFVAGVSAVLVVGYALYTKSFDASHAVALAVQAGLIYTTAVGLYETVKNLLNKF